MLTGSKIGLILASLIISTAPAFAQQTSSNKVSEQTDWSVFVENNPKECWAVSQPKESINTRDGRVVAVRRGDILLFVYYSPSKSVTGQVSFTGGYPFAKDSNVSLNVDGKKFNMFTDGDWAWAASKDDDAKIIAAMKRGAKAVFSARSARGTKTEDTFSLLGFTASVDDAAKRCK